MLSVCQRIAWLLRQRQRNSSMINKRNVFSRWPFSYFLNWQSWWIVSVFSPCCCCCSVLLTPTVRRASTTSLARPPPRSRTNGKHILLIYFGDIRLNSSSLIDVLISRCWSTGQPISHRFITGFVIKMTRAAKRRLESGEIGCWCPQEREREKNQLA